MKIDPNAPAYPTVQHFGDYGVPPVTHTGIPIRLAIAAQIMAGMASANLKPECTNRVLATVSLDAADALIAAHNEDSK